MLRFGYVKMIETRYIGSVFIVFKGFYKEKFYGFLKFYGIYNENSVLKLL